MAAVATLLTDSLARFQSFLRDELTGLSVNLEQHTGNSGGDSSAWLGEVVQVVSATYQQALAASMTRAQLLEPEVVQAVIAALQGGRSKQLSGGIGGDAGNSTDQQQLVADSNGAAATHQAAAGANGVGEPRSSSSSSQEGNSAGGDTGPGTPANETRTQNWSKYAPSIPSDAQDGLEAVRAAEAGGDQAATAAAAHGSPIRNLLPSQQVLPAQQQQHLHSEGSNASSRGTSADGANSRGLSGLLPGHSNDGLPAAAAAAGANGNGGNLSSIGSSGSATGAMYNDGDLLTNQVLQQYRDQFSTGTLPAGSNAAAVLSLANQRMQRANQQQAQQQQQHQFHQFSESHNSLSPGLQGRMSMPGGDWHSSAAGAQGNSNVSGHISGRLSESNLVLPQQFKDMQLGSAHSSRPVSPYSTDGGLTSVASTGGRIAGGGTDMGGNRSAQQQAEHASLSSAYAAAARQLAPSGSSSPHTSWLDSGPSRDSSQQQQQQSPQHLDAATLLSLASLQQQQHLQFMQQGSNGNGNAGMDVSLNAEMGVPRALLSGASPEMLNLLQASGMNLGGDSSGQGSASAAATALQAAGLLEGLGSFNPAGNSAASGAGHAGGSQSGPLPRISNLGGMHSLQQQQQQQQQHSRNSGQLPFQNSGFPSQGSYGGGQSDMYQSDPSFSLFGDRLFELQPIGQDAGSLPTSAQRTLNLFAAAAAAANGGMQDVGVGSSSSAPLNLGNPAFNAMNLGMLGGTDADLLDVSIGMHPHINAAAPNALSMASIGGLASLGSSGHSGTFTAADLARGAGMRMSMSGLDSRTSPAGSGPSSPLPPRTADMPARFRVLPGAVQQRIVAVCRANPVISLRDFDDKVVNKLSLLVEAWGVGEALAMLDHLEQRMRTKQGVMKNGPGYLDVAVCSHLDMLKAQGSCPKTMKLEDYAMQVLSPPVFHELQQAVNSNRWLAWEHFDQGIIQLVKKLPRDSAVEKLQEITYHSFKNVDNIKGCIMSILNSKIREDRRRQ